MMTVLFLLLFMLDIQHPPRSDSPVNKFVVTDMADNSATSGCAMNPSSGRLNADMISVDWAGVNEPHEGEASPARQREPRLDNDASITPTLVPYDPPGQPEQCPEPPPAAITSEPSTVAILTISAVTLLFLLFGRKRQKLYRRPR